MRFNSQDGAAKRSRTLAARVQHPTVHLSYIIPVLSKALQIVALLETADRSFSLKEVCLQTGVAHTTAYRILRTLAAYGYFPDGDHGSYRLKHKHPFASELLLQDEPCDATETGC
jgi:hypothetical protein